MQGERPHRAVPPPRKKSTKKKSRSPLADCLALARVLYRPQVLIPLACLCAAIVLAPFVHRWIPELEGRAEYALTPDCVVLSSTHEWLPDEFRMSLLARAGLGPEASLLQEDIAARIEHACRHEPWVQEVRAVRVQRDRTVFVDVTLRVPVTLLQMSEGYYPLDAEGILLPPKDFSDDDVGRLPVATGVSSLPTGPAGERWEDPVVLGACRIAELLVERREGVTRLERLGLKEIVLPRRESLNPSVSELNYELVSTGGSRIVWGAPPGSEALEASTEQKLARLEFYIEQYGCFEIPKGPSRIDIRRFDTIHAAPLAADPVILR